ncbi:hypothetical protein NDU88_005408 [Pleurodeles waltl]|uniref:Uncharacterized protein n=1 Tax=Pleurodeles waltl TaxID=8319 RepID=A0AAV7SLL5_PLEWA|nr:hypothetical protein NDU88_005408 [Pleurodeles waltl]
MEELLCALKNPRPSVLGGGATVHPSVSCRVYCRAAVMGDNGRKCKDAPWCLGVLGDSASLVSRLAAPPRRSPPGAGESPDMYDACHQKLPCLLPYSVFHPGS